MIILSILSVYILNLVMICVEWKKKINVEISLKSFVRVSFLKSTAIYENGTNIIGYYHQIYEWRFRGIFSLYNGSNLKL